ncbi:MAG: carbonic anhydrase [Planctomycetota bacterium]
MPRTYIGFVFAFLAVVCSVSCPADQPSNGATLTTRVSASEESAADAQSKRVKQAKTRNLSATAALQQLKRGNARFLTGAPRHPHETVTHRQLLENGQHPFAVVLGCSDSRVCPELVFDQGFGDLFVVRVAGNVVDTDVTASIEYATDHLETKLIVVMGHTGCGAVTATVDHLNNPDGEAAEVMQLLYQIEPAVITVDANLNRDERLSQSIENNVRMAVRRLSRVPDLRAGVTERKLQIVGAIYDMHTGKVRFLD